MEEFEVIRANLLPVAGTITDNDMILIVQGGKAKRALPSAMKGKQGDPGLSAFLGVNDTYVLWKQGASGAWQTLFALEKIRGPKGEKPKFRKVDGTLQMKYEGEPDSAFVNIFDREELKLKFSDLTPAEIDLLKLHFSDLTEDEIKVLQKPATDAATEVRAEMVQISEEANQIIEETNTAKNNADVATQKANTAAEAADTAKVNANKAANGANEATDLVVAAIALAEEKAALANTAAGNANTAAEAANTAKGNADKAASDANTAATLANEKAVLADTAAVLANTAKDNADAARVSLSDSVQHKLTEVDNKMLTVKDGKTPVLDVGNVQSGEKASASVVPAGEDSGGNPKYNINLTLPKGDNGLPPVIETGTITTGEPDTEASATLVPNGQTAGGNPKYLLNLTIPRGFQGIPGTGSGNVSVTGTGLVTGKKYLFVPGANGSTVGTFVEYVAPTIPEQVQPDWNATEGKGAILNKPAIPTNVGELNNDVNYATETSVDNKLDAHNESETAHTDIRQKISDVEAIARGKSRAKVFDTVAALDTWLAVPANVSTLQVGDNFYIKATNVPDYWWDGTEKQPIEGEKVDLTEYLKSTDAASTYLSKTDAENTYAKKTFVQSAVDFVSTVTASFTATVVVQLLTWLNSLRASFPAVADFIALTSRLESYTTVSTVADLNVNYRYIYVTLSSNASLSASRTGATYNGRSITAYVYCSSARTIAIPTTGSYVSMCGSSYTCPAGKWVEFNLECINGAWHIAKLEQE